MGVLEKIADIQFELGRTQKNKATEGHVGLLKAKLAKLRRELLDGPKQGGNSAGKEFEVVKYGDARVALIAFPSVGKSTLLSTLTNTQSVVSAHEFTTLECIPGILYHKGSKIQLLDLPGIIEGASQGKGRGRQVISVARSADLILVMLDATKSDVQRQLLEKEMDAVGIRINRAPPDIYFKPKKAGGIAFNTTLPLTKVSEKTCLSILKEYRVHNADVLIREDCTVDQFIDVVEGNRQYIPALYVYNKIDAISLEEVDRLAREPHSVVVSCSMELNLDFLVERIWAYLGLCRVYTKRQGTPPDFSDPIILRGGSRVEDACRAVHRSLAEADQFRHALVWGRSAKHNPQRVGLAHVLDDEDVIQIATK